MDSRCDTFLAVELEIWRQCLTTMQAKAGEGYTFQGYVVRGGRASPVLLYSNKNSLICLISYSICLADLRECEQRPAGS